MAAALNREILAASDRGKEVLLELVNARVQEFNAVNVATVLNRLSRLRQNAEDRDTDGKQVGTLVDDALLLRAIAVIDLQAGNEWNARSVSTIAHALGSLEVRDADVTAAVVKAVSKHCKSFDRQGLANVMWALAKLPPVANTKTVFKELVAALDAVVDEFNPQELSNVTWALGRLGVRDNRLMSKISDVVRKRVNRFTPQGLATVAAAYGRIGIFIEPLLRELGNGAQQQLKALNGRDAVQLFWAFAKFKLQDVELFKGLCKRAAAIDVRKESADFVVMFLWSFGTLHWLPDDGGALLKRLVNRATELAPNFGARRTVRLLTAIAKLTGGSEVGFAGARAASGQEKGLRQLGAALGKSVAQSLDRMQAQEVGIAAWALATLQPGSWQETTQAILGRSETQLSELNWWSIAHVEYARRRLGDDGTNRWARRLTTRCSEEVERIRQESDAWQRGPSQVFVESLAGRCEQHLPADGGKVLVCGHGALERRAFRALGHEVVRWRRFANGPTGVATCAWPKGDAGTFDGCAMRFPDSAESFDFALHAAASLLRPGAPIWVYGDVREGVLSATKALRELFQVDKRVTEHGDTRVFTATRGKGKKVQAPLVAWAKHSKLDLGAGPQPWVSYPGFFAGGLLDVMTKYLLDRLTEAACEGKLGCKQVEDLNVLDFACGSGALAAGLLARGCIKGASITLLDADALAVHAAQSNVPDAELVVLADGLQGLATEDGEDGSTRTPGEGPFNLVVSNPPVHRGHPDDLGVLLSLLVEVPKWMQLGGEIWLVTQEHIPTGRLFALACREHCERATFPHVEMLPTDDGRFVVWKAVLAPAIKAVKSKPKAFADNAKKPLTGDGLGSPLKTCKMRSRRKNLPTEEQTPLLDALQKTQTKRQKHPLPREGHVNDFAGDSEPVRKRPKKRKQPGVQEVGQGTAISVEDKLEKPAPAEADFKPLPKKRRRRASS